MQDRLCECKHTRAMHVDTGIPVNGQWIIQPCQQCRYDAQFPALYPLTICNTFREMDNLKWLMWIKEHPRDA